MSVFYVGNYTVLLKDSKEDLNKWRYDMFLDKVIRSAIIDMLP